MENTHAATMKETVNSKNMSLGITLSRIYPKKPDLKTDLLVSKK